ncbi:hypothetical protein H6P81_000068 [Aristolochia fimbriata]|uniref:RING-type domain-containing protein n=1 Tax=Aristolochia fimbriata TaxID=158543 RepID=A0AAV7F5G2_ARIFI|nr:hypothetical protein H6P81_000068 [Aristolochia fimbriata]
MICLGFPESRFQVVVLIFYTCIWLPLQRLKEAAVEAVLTLFGKGQRPVDQRFNGGAGGGAADLIFSDLVPVMKFREVRGTAAAAAATEETICSVCLMEYGEEEEVSRLPVCGHVFHVPCIERWMERDQFSCPLCRSPIFGSNDVAFFRNDY